MNTSSAGWSSWLCFGVLLHYGLDLPPVDYFSTCEMHKLVRPVFSAAVQPFTVCQTCPCSTASGARTDGKHQTLYEVLGVPDTASSGQIRRAFISKSKKNHPDVNPGKPHQHDVFVEISEAYKVLSDPDCRRIYDLKLQQKNGSPMSSQSHTSRANPFGSVPNHRQTTSSYNYKKHDANDRYSQQRAYNFRKAISPQRTLYNKLTFFGAFLFMLTGSTMIFFLIRARHRKYREQVEESSRRANLVYMEARERAKANGLKKQLEILIAGSYHRELTELSAKNVEDLADAANLIDPSPDEK